MPARLGLRRAFELSSLQFVLPAACCLPLFVSRPSSLPSPSSSQLAFVVRNLVFIGFLGLNFNLVLVLVSQIYVQVVAHLIAYIHTYVRMPGMPGAPPTRRFIRVTACALLCSCPVPSWPLLPTTLSFGACLRLFFFLCRFQLQSSWTPHRRAHLSMRKHKTRDSVGLLLSTLSCHQAIFLSSLSSSTWG